MLASLIASRQKEGIIVSDEECSAICGWAPVTISGLRQQAAFRRLIQHYLGSEPIAAPIPAERLQALGLSTLEELQARLHDDPDSFSKRELMDMAELLLIKARSVRDAGPVSAAASGGAGVRVAINFVEAKARELPNPNPVIDVTPIYNESATADISTATDHSAPAVTADENESATPSVAAATSRGKSATSGLAATVPDTATSRLTSWPENATSPPQPTPDSDPGSQCAAPAAKPKPSSKRRARSSDPRLGMPPWPQPRASS